MAHGRRIGRAQRGFDKRVSFRGQEEYWPNRRGTSVEKDSAQRPGMEHNVDDQAVPQKGYITDELTDYAVNWVEKPAEEPAVFRLPFAQGPALRICPGGAPRWPLREQTHAHARLADQPHARPDVGAEPTQFLAWCGFRL